MLLAIAIVASFGVTAAFAGVNYTNAHSASHYQQRIDYLNEGIASFKYKQGTLTEVQELWNHYFTRKTMLQNAGLTGEIPALDADMMADLIDLQIKYAGVDYGTDADNDAVKDLYDFKAHKDDGNSQKIFAAAEGVQANLQSYIKTATDLFDTEDLYLNLALYSKLAEKDAEKEAEAKKAAEVAAKIAAATKGIDASTPAGKLLYDGTVAKMWAQESLAAAKTAADAAKKAIAVAQKGAYTEAQAAILDAQAIAYQNMAAGINTAVADYVDSVYVAIADFYASLNP